MPGSDRRESGRVLVTAVLLLLLVAALAFYMFHRSPSPTPTAATPSSAPTPVESGPDEDPAKAAERFNREKTAVAPILQEADKVEPYRIQPSTEMENGIDSQQIVYKGKPLKKSLGVRLATILLDSASYLSPGNDTKMCAFQPRLAFRFWKGKQFLDVLVCFDCDQLMVVERDPAVPLRSMGGLPARFRVGGDIEPVREDLKEIMLKAFPNDPDLSAILDPHGMASQRPPG